MFKSFSRDILEKKSFYIPLIIIAIMGYGFSLFNRTIGWDDFLRDHYFGDIALAGRWGEAAWIRLLGLQSFDPFVDRFVALLFLIVASVLFCLLLYSITKSKNVLSYSIAASLFISYPLINEIWEYCGANLFVAGGLALTTTTILLLRNNERKIKWILISSVLLVLPISSYESSIFYYLALICMVILMDNLFNGKYHCFKDAIITIGYFIIPVFIAFIIRLIISVILRGVYDLPSVGGGATDINWLTDAPSDVLFKIAGGNFLKYVLSALVYFPITEFLIAVVFFFLVTVSISIRKKQWSFFLLGFLLLLSLFSQAFLQGTALPYRTAQTLTLFIAFIGYMVVERVFIIDRKFIRIACYVFMFGICWYQAVYLNRLLGLNNLRSENEAFIVRSIGERLERDFDKKPVVFISPYSSGTRITKSVSIGDDSWNERLYNRIVKSMVPEGYTQYLSDRFVETNVNCATEEYSQIQEIFAYYGYDIDVVGPVEKPHTPNYTHKDTRLLKDAQTVAENCNMRPYEIYDNGDYLIVALSNKRYFNYDDEE